MESKQLLNLTAVLGFAALALTFFLRLPWVVLIVGASPMIPAGLLLLADYHHAAQYTSRFNGFIWVSGGLFLLSLGLIRHPDAAIADIGTKLLIADVITMVLGVLISIAGQSLSISVFNGRRSPDPIPVLIHRLENGNWWARIRAARNLGDLGDPQAIVPLIGALRIRDLDIWMTVVRALARLGDVAVTPLIRVLETGDTRQRTGAALALGRIGADRTVDPLIKALSDTDSSLRAAAAWALGELGAVHALPMLLILQDKDLGRDAMGRPVKNSVSYAIRRIQERQRGSDAD